MTPPLRKAILPEASRRFDQSVQETLTPKPWNSPHAGLRTKASQPFVVESGP
jgi:hypothetical protein